MKGYTKAGAVALVVAVAGCGSHASKVTAKDTASTTLPATVTTNTSPPAVTPPSTDGRTATTPTTAAGADFRNVNRSDPTAVAEAALQANFTSNTSTDSGPFDAVKRSLIWYSQTGAAQVLASAPTGPVGAEWLTWTHHQVATTVTIQVNHDPGAPPDTATAAYRQFNVLVTPHGSDGWTAPPDQYQCFVTLTSAGPGNPWQVSTVQTAQ